MIYELKAYTRAFNKLEEEDQERVRMALRRLETAFGRPHAHSGAGIRPFGRYFELRAGLLLRIIFIASKGDFFLSFVGTHDQVKRWAS